MMRRTAISVAAVLFIQAVPAPSRWDGKAAPKLGVSGPAAAFAASPWTEVKGYPARARWKMIFGLENVAFGWMEIFAQPHDSAHGGENLAVGAAKGLVNAVGQTVGGALHAATAPATCLDIPLPDGGFQFD